MSKSAPLAGVNIAPNATFYLRWTYQSSEGTLITNAQGIGIDDVTLTATLEGGTPPTPAASITTTASAFNSPYCITATAGSAPFNVAYTSSGTFTGGFKVQLSNASGEFPTNVTDNIIGSGTSSPISAAIPKGTPSGTKYRLRVVNDAPATYGSNNGSDLVVNLTSDSNPVTVTPATAQTIITTGTGDALTASAAANSTFTWLYGTSAAGPYTSAIGGATSATYTVRGADFPGVGTYYLVAQATVTTDCGTATGLSAPITVTVSAPPTTPALLVSASTLSDFGSLAVGAGTGLKSFMVEGNNLKGGIIITPPAGFEIRTGNNPFACCTIELQPAGGNVPSTTIDVRFAPTAPQAYSETIPVQSAGLPDQAVAVTGTGVNPIYPATLSTTAITELTPTSANTGGTVAADGGNAVTARGIVWAKTPNPTISVTTKTADGAGTGAFASAITGLVPGTTYFVRAYATNSASTAYGEEISFTTVTVPLAAEPTTQPTLTASQVASTSLQLNLAGGDGKKRLVVARRGSAVDAVPTDATTYIADTEFGKGSVLGVGNFVVYNGTGDNVTVTGLRANATYHFSVFAFNDNDTPYAENYLVTAPGTLVQATSAAPAALLLEENFDYAAGSLLTANGWAAHSGAGTNSIAVTATDGLSYSGYSASSGKAAATVGNGEDVNLKLTEPVYAGTPVYTSLLLNVISAGTAEYFFHLGPAAIGSTFKARLFTRAGSTSGTVQFGISGNGSTIKYTTESYPLNTTHLLVVKYDYDEAGSITKLFVNPAAGAEPATASAEVAELGSSPANIGAMAIRQGTNVPKLTIDGIRVGNSYRVVRTGLICLEPVPAFTAATACVGSATAFTDASTVVESNATYAWDVESDGKVDYTTVGNISHTYAAAGTYTATLVITQGACSATYTQKVTVRELPTATLSGTATVCAGTSTSLSVALTGTGPWSLTYTDGTTPVAVTGITSSPYVVSVSPAATSTYSLLAVSDANCTGAAFTGTAIVTVNPLPVPTITATPSNTVYTGGVATNLYLGYGPQSLTLTAAGGTKYSWSGPTGLSKTDIANPVFTAGKPGTFVYTVTVTNEFGCVATKAVTLKVVDVRGGKKNAQILVCHKGVNTWEDIKEVEGHLLIHKEQLGSCDGNTLTASAAATAVATEYAATAHVFEAYPNPFTERATLRFRAAETGKAQLLVYNSVGKLVATIYDGVAEGGRTYEFTVEGAALAEGVYTCRLTTNGKVETKRLVLVK
ncbi:T9SS type A sorting domain-containing protein [Hymenobacter sp. BT188]|uniref:T9SS type A sorting domain-containing protein n=1 Tax=Hymenobacter sp. BT188 TaxID=2763504 RepID=UPI00165144D7|nr:T9SS type A sorting domain-containing protein [Hymenobacter sp. BT188]MBC6608117.1 T9SS type A sorting domain-containing protein [Hymenobacter sp. BT188]